MRLPFFIIILFITSIAHAQTDSTKHFTFSGYVELYYSYDFANPANHLKPNFVYNHKRHNELALNLAYVKANYNNENVRGNLALMVGDYAQYNLSAEPNWAQFVYEANVGVKLSKKENIWLDAGIMPSHIGFESATSADCWALTRSMSAENSPYFETGAKLSYTSKNEKLFAALYFLNGWQRIRKPDFIQKPSFGVQLTYKPNSQLTLNYSNFIGTDKPDSLNATRMFHNLYAIFEPSKKFGLTVGVDVGSDKFNAQDYGTWFAPIIIARYSINDKNSIAARIEMYNDEKQIIVATNSANGFQTSGFSINYDHAIQQNVLWRIEAKMYQSKDNIFEGKNNNFSLTTLLSIKL